MHRFARSSAILATFALPFTLTAQGVTVQRVTDARFFGGLGTIVDMAARMAGTSMHDIQATMSVSGHRLRDETANAATIFDADAGRIITIDHKAKSYSSVTLEEMAAAMTQAQQSARANAAKQKNDAKDPKGDMNVKYTVSVDRPGQREKIAGYDAERVFVTVNMEAEVTPEGEKTQQAGTMVILVDQWMSNTAPQIAAMKEFYRAYSEKAGQAFQSQTVSLQAAFSADPRLRDGMAAAAKEMEKVPGIALRSVSYAAVVPVGMKFDRALVLADASAAAAADKAKGDEKPKSGGLKGMMGAIRAAAEESNKSAAEKSAQSPKQVTLMSIRDDVKEISVGAVPASIFEPPAGYREVKRRGASPE